MAAVTLRDVAKLAGVSIRTVSNVVNGYVHVADVTRQRVQTACDALGYRPNMLARSLRSGRSGFLAMVIPELDVPYFAELARAVIREAQRYQYSVLIEQTDGETGRERELIFENPRARLFDGVIFSPLTLLGQDLAERDDDIPVVLLGEKKFDGSHDHIAIDNVAAAREATLHLLQLGRSRIAAIGDQPYATGETAQLRTQGFRQAHAAAGAPVDERLVIGTPRFHREDGARAMRALLALPEPPDAVFCYNDLLALGAMRAVLECGLRIPEDIAIVGFDDIEDGRFATPSLTTVAPDKDSIARLAVERLMLRIDGQHEARPEHVVAPYRMIVRESTSGRC